MHYFSGIIFVALAGLWTSSAAIAQGSGRFVGELQFSTKGTSGTDFRLLQNFEFRDGGGRRWLVPENTVVNGASIPQWLWPVVGYPWNGEYRKASVVHDHFCMTRSRPWQEVHRAFYDAMLANGVSEEKARLFYMAVYYFGPRWTSSDVNFKVCSRQAARSGRVSIEQINAMCATPQSGKGIVTWQPPKDEAALQQVLAAARRGGPLAHLEAVAERQLAQRSPPELARTAAELGLLQARPPK